MKQDILMTELQFAGMLGEQSICAVQENVILNRKNAARMIHEFLLKVKKEKDETSINPAKKLRDLYDCHTCVNHVAQVYLKGIIVPESNVFGMDKSVTRTEAEFFIERIHYKEKRQLPNIDNIAVTTGRITYHEAMLLMQDKRNIKLIDVRSREEYDKQHIERTCSIPLVDFMKNPYLLGQDRNRTFLFYCEQGYQSEIAANGAREAGYQDVRYFADDSE